MTDYESLGLDRNLRPLNSPAVTNNENRTTGYEFNSQNERNAITATNIQNFSFSTGRGGTLTLGGTTNGDGLMELRDSGGTLIFTGNNTGHHYYGTSGVEQVKVDSSGLHNYNAGGTEQIKVDFTGFHAYGSAGTSVELVKVDNTGLHGYLSNGTETMNVGPAGINAYGYNGDTFEFYDVPGGTRYGKIGYNLSSGSIKFFSFIGENGANFMLADADGTIGILSGGVLVKSVNGILSLNGQGVAITTNGEGLQVDGTVKTAIVPTSKEYNALYCIESPEVWFMDFCESKDKIDTMFLEVTEKPYRFVKCEDENGKEMYQVWGVRKGFKNIRFESKTREQFEKNNNFWALPLR
jgi:hypothetical protein